MLSSNTCCFWPPIVIHLVATNRLPLNQTRPSVRDSAARIGQYLTDTRRCALVSRRASGKGSLWSRERVWRIYLFILVSFFLFLNYFSDGRISSCFVSFLSNEVKSLSNKIRSIGVEKWNESINWEGLWNKRCDNLPFFKRRNSFKQILIAYSVIGSSGSLTWNRKRLKYFLTNKDYYYMID